MTKEACTFRTGDKPPGRNSAAHNHGQSRPLRASGWVRLHGTRSSKFRGDERRTQDLAGSTRATDHPTRRWRVAEGLSPQSNTIRCDLSARREASPCR